MGFDYSHPVYRAARAKAIKRSGGVCQLCGQRDATEAHHWAINYPAEVDTTANDLTALCAICHEIATTIRRFHGDVWNFKAKFQETIAECFTSSESKGFPPSSCTARPESTRYSPSTSRRRRSPESAAATGPQPTTPGSGNSKPSGPSGSIPTTGLPSRPAALRAVIETGARKLKQGPQVREGLVVTDTSFEYDETRYGSTLAKLSKSTQYTVPVVVQRNRIMRTRAMFDLPWAVEFWVDGDDELVSAEQLESWLDIGGRRIGLGDWRPEKSGQFGRFKMVSMVHNV